MCCWRSRRAFVTAGIPDVADVSAAAGYPAVIGSIAISSVPADPGIVILVGVFVYCTILYNETY